MPLGTSEPGANGSRAQGPWPWRSISRRYRAGVWFTFHGVWFYFSRGSGLLWRGDPRRGYRSLIFHQCLGHVWRHQPRAIILGSSVCPKLDLRYDCHRIPVSGCGARGCPLSVQTFACLPELTAANVFQQDPTLLIPSAAARWVRIWMIPKGTNVRARLCHASVHQLNSALVAVTYHYVGIHQRLHNIQRLL